MEEPPKVGPVLDMVSEPSAMPQHDCCSQENKNQMQLMDLATEHEYEVYNVYSIAWMFEAVMVLNYIGLGVCYVIARYYKHIGIFCNIADLGVNLPERIPFRFFISLSGGFLIFLALPIRDVVACKIDRKLLPNFGCVSQLLSGLGIVLAAACGIDEILWFHRLAATIGFAGGMCAQIVYAFALLQQDEPSPSSKVLFNVRFSITTVAMVLSAMYSIGEEPVSHICEWGVWFCLGLWYYTFRFDMESFYIATVNEVSKCQSG